LPAGNDVVVIETGGSMVIWMEAVWEGNSTEAA
jgi:hypothetical protein